MSKFDVEDLLDGILQIMTDYLNTQIAAVEADKVAKGRGCKGITHGRAKLTEQDVIDIRASNKKGTELAEDYNVSQQLISFIINRKIWTHLPA
jgi:hypothetical protein